MHICIKTWDASSTPESCYVPLPGSPCHSFYQKQPLFWFLPLYVRFSCFRTSCKWNDTVCPFLCWFLLLNTMLLGFIHFAACISRPFFYCWVAFHYMTLTIYPFSCWWIWDFSSFWLLWVRFYEDSCTRFFFLYVFLFLLDQYLEVETELLGWRVDICLVL